MTQPGRPTAAVALLEGDRVAGDVVVGDLLARHRLHLDLEGDRALGGRRQGDADRGGLGRGDAADLLLEGVAAVDGDGDRDARLLRLVPNRKLP